MSDQTTQSEVQSKAEIFQFQAEINQLMSLIINAFYSNKDVFLRELISNASDALDKIRHQSLTNSDALSSNTDLGIKIYLNHEDHLLTIEDSGIGMTKQDLINNLGTVARSGTREFMEAFKEGNADMNLIGQFGVGFYSAYLVADKVQVVTKHNDDRQYIWESDAGGQFTIREDSNMDLKRGTRLNLYIKQDAHEYLNEHRLKQIIKTHSQFTQYPISLRTIKKVEKEVTDDEAESSEPEIEVKDDEPGVEVEDLPNEKEKKKKTIYEEEESWEIVNDQKPIWLRSTQEVTEEEYHGFYKSLGSHHEAPLAYKHFKVEGQLEFTALIYVPKRPPINSFNLSETKHNLKLYVRRVFITDNCSEIIPDWLNFLDGVVDSEDLPLNISRETFQQNRIMKIIKNNIVKRAIELIEETYEDKEKFKEFYSQFSKNIKLGIYEDAKNREKLSKLCRYYSSKSEDEMTSLTDYVSRMKDNQDQIYYITGESQKKVKKSPFVEALRKKDLEVLYMTEPIDEYVLQQLRRFDGKELASITKEDLKLPETDEEKKEREKTEEANKHLCNEFKTALGNKVSKVQLSTRLTDSPCVLVTSKYGHSANMERIMKAQALNQNFNVGIMSQKILEINPNHKIIKEIRMRIDKAMEENRNADKETFKSTYIDTPTRELIWLLYDNTLLASGFSLDDPTDYVTKINNIIALNLSIENEDLPELSTETTTSNVESTSSDQDVQEETQSNMDKLD